MDITTWAVQSTVTTSITSQFGLDDQTLHYTVATTNQNEIRELGIDVTVSANENTEWIAGNFMNLSNDSGTTYQTVEDYDNRDELDSRKVELLEKINDSIWRYIIPVNILVGFLGNTLTLFIAGDRTKKHPTMIRLLAVVDNCNIAISIVDVVGYFQYGPAMIFAQNNWGCRLGLYVIIVLQHYEAWVVIMLTLERYVSIMYPLKAHSCLNLGKLKILMGVILVAVLIDYIPQMTSYEIIDTQFDYPCQPSSQFGRWWTDKFYTTWQFVFFIFGPFGILLICNGAIIWQLINRNRKESQLGVNKKYKGANLRKQAPLLLSVSFIFLLTQAPLQIYLLTDFGNTVFSEDPLEQQYLDLGFNVCLMLTYMNYSANFFIYVLTHTAMRQRFTDQFSCKSIGKLYKGS